jgi:hypothetical protein
VNKYTLETREYYWRKCEAFTSWRLFLACWRQYRTWLRGAIDDPQSDDDVLGWLDSIAAERVNNPRSSFYITGD